MSGVDKALLLNADVQQMKVPNAGRDLAGVHRWVLRFLDAAVWNVPVMTDKPRITSNWLYTPLLPVSVHQLKLCAHPLGAEADGQQGVLD